ncbi:ABC transporter ATP-binding protein [Spirochaetia bacterium]|nr:ABC transporter ATP-binding protein [Spirochaetia bacterium]
MIKNISIHNFKALKKLENVQLNKITLIGGKNNSGKSSLLEALFLYVDRKASDTLLRLLGWRQFFGIQATPEAMWAPFFFHFSFSDDVAITVIEDSEKQGELSIAYKENYTPKVSPPINNNGILSSQSGGGTVCRSLSIVHKTGSNGSEKTIDFIGHPLIHSTGGYYEVEQDSADTLPHIFYMGSRMLLDADNIERLGKLDKNDAQNKILPLLQKFEPNLQRFQVIKEGTTDVIYADLGNKNKVPVNLLGDGFCRCLTIALLLVADTIDILLLDEFGIGVHYSMLNTLWQFIIDASNKLNCQIIATTHSYEMIQAFYNAVNEKEYDDAGYIRLQKKNVTIQPKTTSQRSSA